MPSGAQVWITNFGSNQASVFDAHGRELLGSLTLTAAPSGVDSSPEGHHAYVTNAKANELTVIDVASQRFCAPWPLAPSPMALGGRADNW
jgi:YVTN family beta-propeller protein